MNTQTMTLTFFVICTVYIKKLGQFFFHDYYLTCLDKDNPVLSKVYFNGTFNFSNSLLKCIEKNNKMNLFNAMTNKIRAADLGPQIFH